MYAGAARITVSTSGQPDQSRISARFEDILCTLKRRRVIERAYPHTVKALPADINFGDGHGIFPPLAISSLPGDSLGGLQRFERAQLQVSVSLSSQFASRFTSRRRYCLDPDRCSTGFGETQSKGSTIRRSIKRLSWKGPLSLTGAPLSADCGGCHPT